MDKKETPLKQIRTFQGDVAEALEKQRESLVSIQRAEQLKKGSGARTPATPEIIAKRKQFFYLLLGSLFFLVLGGFGAKYAYNEFLRKTAAPEIAAPENRFLSANTEMRIDVFGASRETLISSLNGATEGTPRGELKHVVLNKIIGEETELLSISEFLKMLESRAPGSLVRSFDPLFMYGALGNSIFLIIKLSSFENAFAGMLNWEKNLSQDILPLFASREYLGGLPQEPVFADLTDRNKDIRMLYFESQPVILYSFFDNDTLIITDGLETLRTLIDRLTQEKLSR
ncbi:MAG: hypothetical protein AAB719_01630 [Patescibacteria group bacterium]